MRSDRFQLEFPHDFPTSELDAVHAHASAVATIRQLEQVLRAQQDQKPQLHKLWQPSPEVIRSEMERQAAPVATRDAVLALLTEVRAKARWDRRIALASLAVALATLLLVLLRG